MINDPDALDEDELQAIEDEYDKYEDERYQERRDADL